MNSPSNRPPTRPGRRLGARHSAWIYLALFSAVACWHLPTIAQESPPKPDRPTRGVWVANVGSETLSDPQHIADFVSLAERCGINTLYVVVWNRGMTTYPSRLMEREFGRKCDPRYAGFDALETIITAAHARDIRVIAWFEFGFSSSYRQADGGPILVKHPHWAARDREGQIATKNGFQWMNAFRPEVQDFVLALLAEIVTTYDVDGIQGDDRLPACPSTAGYDDWTVAQYAKEHDGRRPPDDPLDADWIDWRTQILNDFMRRMHAELKRLDPELIVSAAPSVYPWSKQNYLQDWPTWVKNGWVDEICPQIYREEVAAYEQELDKILATQITAPDRARLFPGILVRTADEVFNGPENLRGMVAANRARAIHGEVFFYARVLREHEALFQELYASHADSSSK